MQIPSSAGVYMITHNPTGLYYVGSAVNIRLRISAHMSLLRYGNHQNPRLQASYTHRDDYTVTYELFDTRSEAYNYEQDTLDKLLGSPLCCNFRRDARNGRYDLSKVTHSKRKVHSEETKQRMRETALQKDPSAFSRGHTISPEQRAIISEVQRTRPRKQGLIFSEEWKANMSMAARERGLVVSRKVSIDDIVYPNAAYAAEALNLSRSTIVNRIKSDDIRWSAWRYL